MADAKLEKGDRVRLLTAPTGQESSTLPLTVGNIYLVRYTDGCCVCTSTDHPGLDARYHIDRVEKVTK